MSRAVVAHVFGIDPEQINEPLMRWAWEQRTGGSRQKLLLVVLAIFTEPDGFCRLSHRQLSQVTSIKGRTLVSGFNALRKLGFLEGEEGAYFLLEPSAPPLEEGERLSLWISPETRATVLAGDHWQCVACGSPDKLQIDHIVPQSRGGFHDIDNLQTLCGPCNLSKGDMTQEEWDNAKRRPQ